MQKAKRIHNPLLLLQRKRLAEVKKNVQLLDALNTFYDSEDTAAGIHFLSCPHCSQRLIVGVT